MAEAVPMAGIPDDADFGLEVKPWTTSIVSVRNDPIMCCFVTFFPFCFMPTFVRKVAPFDWACLYIDERMGILVAIATFLLLGTGVGFFLFVMILAFGIQDKYHIDEFGLITCCKSFFCPCCYLLQMYNEVNPLIEEEEHDFETLLTDLVKFNQNLEGALCVDDAEESKEIFHDVVSRSRLFGDELDTDAMKPDDLIDEVLKYKDDVTKALHIEQYMEVGEKLSQALQCVIETLTALNDFEEEDENDDTVEKLNHKADFIQEEPHDGVRNHQFAEWLKEDNKHTTNCMTLPLTCITFVLFLFVAANHANVTDSYRMRECLEGVVTEIRAKHSVSGLGQDIDSIINITSVTSVEELWSWIEGGLVPAMAGTPLKPGFVRTFNKVVGQIQLRETRYTSGECQVGEELEKYYRQGCHTQGLISSEPFGVAPVNGSIRDSAFVPGYGISELNEYNAARFFSWLDVKRPDVGTARAAQLRNWSWVDSGTQSLEVIIVLFNAEIKAYGHINVKLSLQRGGLIKIGMEVRTLWASMHENMSQVLVDILWVMCVLKILANSIQKVVDNKGIGGCCKRCCMLPPKEHGGWWLGLDWVGIIFAFTVIGMMPMLMMGYGALATKVGGMSDPFGNSTATEVLTVLADDNTTNLAGLGTYYGVNADVIMDIEYLIWLKMMHRLAMFWYAMVYLLRWFRGFRGQAKMAQITMTLSSTLPDLLHFAVIFFVLFVNFALAGHVLFGSEISEFSTITKALQSSLGMAWGRVDYEPLYEIAPLSSAIWLAGYVLSMVLISMNLLLSIIADHYGGVFHANNSGDRGFNIFGQIKAMFYEAWWSSTYVGRSIYRVIATKLPAKITKSRAMPQYKPEEDRIEIPYETLYMLCDLDPIGFVTVKSLRDAGCDRATAKHLYRKCTDEVNRHLEENYPLELLFDEFDDSMKQYYYAMDSFQNDLRGWFSDKSGSTTKMIPRQAKLDVLTEEIEVAQHIEHKHHHHHSAETMEGEGHHHHHHRQHRDHGDGATTEASHSTRKTGEHSDSRGGSRAPSRVLSRAPSQSTFPSEGGRGR